MPNTTNHSEIVVAASFTCGPLARPLDHALAQMEVPARVTCAPYGQLLELLIDPGSAFAGNPNGLNVCLVGLGDLGRDANDETLRARGLELCEAVRECAARSPAHLLICLCPGAENRAAARALETEIVGALAGIGHVAVCCARDWFATYGIAAPFDPHGDALAHIPFTDEGFAALAIGIARVARSRVTKPKKVIAVDCDFTLWEGACGDLAPQDLRITPRYLAVQRFLRARREAGFLLVICSRNDAERVDRVFAQRGDDLALTRADFVTARVNWAPKWENLASLAQELNLGLDSFVLVDDDAFVCAETAARLPEVTVVQVPVEEDAELVLRQTPALDHFFVTDEDRQRSEGYRADLLRANEARRITSADELNRRLETVIEVVPAEPRHWPRVEQLIARTNQFTSGTYGSGDARAALLRGSAAYVATARDRFGDYGIVAAAIASQRDGDFVVDCFAMSCRVLSRGVDLALLSHLQLAAAEAGHRQLRVRFRHKGRNHLAEAFFAAHAALCDEQDGDAMFVLSCTPSGYAGAPAAEVRP